MKKRKVLFLLPVAALVLSGCTFQEGWETVKGFMGDKVYEPVKGWVENLLGIKQEEKKEEKQDQQGGGQGDHSGEGGGQQGGETEHDPRVEFGTVHEGTEADPLDGADAMTIAEQLADGEIPDPSYYIQDEVTELIEEFNPSFGNFTFYIEGGFECYRLKFGPNYEKFTNENALEVGDTVTVFAQIQNYKGNTPETKGGYVVKIEKPAIDAELESIEISGTPKTAYVAGQAYGHEGLSVTAHYDNNETQEVTSSVEWTYSKATAELNDTEVTITAHYKGKEDSKTVQVTVSEKHTGTETDPLTGAEAALLANELPEGNLSNPSATSDSYYIKGEVIKFRETFNSEYGNYSFEIDGGFVGWRLKNGPNNTAFTNADDLEVGDTVTMYAQIQNFNGTPETYKGYIHAIEKPVITVESVTVTPSALELEVGEQANISATVSPAKASQEVTWKVQNPEGLEVATYQDGKVIAVAAGEATVVATSVADNKVSGLCSVVVTEATKTLQSIAFAGEATKTEYFEGEDYSAAGLKVMAHYDKGEDVDVTGNANITIAPETATYGDSKFTVTASYGNVQSISLDVNVTVTYKHGSENNPLTGAEATAIANELAQGAVTADFYYIKGVVQSFEETFNPTYGNFSFKIDGDFIGWRLKNGANYSLFTSEDDLEVGDTVTMYVQIQNYQGKPESKGGYIVEIVKPTIAPTSIELDKTELELQVGQMAQLTATVLPAKASNKNVEWTVSQTANAVSVENGLVTALAEGEATVVATALGDPTVTASCAVTVTAATKTLTGVELQGTAKTEYFAGEAYTKEGLTLKALYSDQSQEDVSDVATWTISKETAEVGDDEIIISASYGNFSDSKNVSVTVTAKPGSEALPYTVAEARAAVDNGGDITGVYAEGYVSKIVTAYNSGYGNVSFNISADGLTTGDQLQGYRTTVASADDVAVGDKVVLKGNLKKYNTTYEFDAGNTIESRVQPTEVLSVVVSGTATTTEYAPNAQYNHDGLIAIANLDNGAKTDVSSAATWAINPATATLGDTEISVTATYNNVTSSAYVVGVTVTSAPIEQVYKSLAFTVDNANDSINTYTASGSYTQDGFTVDIFACNNNSKSTSWNCIKIGRKTNSSANQDSEPTITTHAAIDKAVTKVGIEFGAVTLPTSGFEAKVKVSANADMSNATEVAFTPVANKTVEVDLGTGTANCYYQFYFNCPAFGSSNGYISILSVSYSAVY